MCAASHALGMPSGAAAPWPLAAPRLFHGHLQGEVALALAALGRPLLRLALHALAPAVACAVQGVVGRRRRQQVAASLVGLAASTAEAAVVAVACLQHLIQLGGGLGPLIRLVQAPAHAWHAGRRHWAGGRECGTARHSAAGTVPCMRCSGLAAMAGRSWCVLPTHLPSTAEAPNTRPRLRRASRRSDGMMAAAARQWGRRRLRQEAGVRTNTHSRPRPSRRSLRSDVGRGRTAEQGWAADAFTNSTNMLGRRSQH